MHIYNKLVRDGIPEIIARDGKQYETRILTDAEYLPALCAKLREETKEFDATHSPEELADILEVLYALADIIGSSPSEIEAIRAEKERQRGGFAKRILLIQADL